VDDIAQHGHVRAEKNGWQVEVDLDAGGVAMGHRVGEEVDPFTARVRHLPAVDVDPVDLVQPSLDRVDEMRAADRVEDTAAPANAIPSRRSMQILSVSS
jgi:hypothetical protein